jgi:uncharacterized membrane protein YqaE (UPF0057 family)
VLQLGGNRKAINRVGIKHNLFSMKQILLGTLALFFFANSALAEVNPATTLVSQCSQSEEVVAISPDLTQMTLDKFLQLTPADYKKATGEKLGIKKSIQLKFAQKALKREMKSNAELRSGLAGGDGITQELYILLAIFCLGWVAMGVKDDFEGSDWIVNLLLTCLCWLPGLIHALVKMKNYYN